MKTGIDVSKWNKKIDWESAKADGVEFAIIRAGYGNGNIDPYAHMNCVKCNSLGIPIGIYWFSYAYSEEMCRNEARKAVAFANKHLLELPIYFDFEYDSEDYAEDHNVNVSRETYCKYVTAFCEEVEKLGYYAAFYVNKDYMLRKTTQELRDRFDMWLADYDRPVYFNNAHMVQITDKGTMSGITGYVDLNQTDRDYPAIIRKAGLNNLK
jgi:GH25 family lysozyme M1 (1,4-beta-N-acetylmuramidase)